MILYHGTYIRFDTIELAKGRRFKDFGQGFYTTQIESQAKQWAVAMQERFAEKEAVVLSFEFDKNRSGDLRALTFPEPTIEWANFVMNNRNPRFNAFNEQLNNHRNQYDIVEGPVANDRIAVVLDQYLAELLSGAALAEALEYRELNHQMSFHTAAAVQLLEKVDEYAI
jgi:hypothetical protein